MVEINTNHEVEFESARERRIDEIEARRDKINQEIDRLKREKNDLCNEIARKEKTEYIDERMEEIEEEKKELRGEFNDITSELFSLED